MSLFSYPIGRETPIQRILDGTGAIDLVEAGSNGATVLALRIAEVSNNATTITLGVYNASDVLVAKICDTEAISAKEIWEPIRIDSVPVVLLGGYSLKATAANADRLHCTGVYIQPPQ